MSESPLVLITNRFDSQLRAQLKQKPEAQFCYVNDLCTDEALLEKAKVLIIRSSTKIDKGLLDKAKNLEFVITATSGFDHIDLKLTAEKNIRTFHIPETQAIAAAELTLFLILGACRKYTLAHSQLRKGDWQRSLLLGRQLTGQTLGIVGLGRVGSEVAKRALGLGLKVIAHDPYIIEHNKDIPMFGYEELMRSSDIVSFHVPKTDETRHMVKKETLEWMNTSAILINMSRGDVVNEADLIEHLLENPEFRAGLDVFAKEPLVTKSKLLSLNNVILTPHVGASTEEALRESSLKSIEMCRSLLNAQSVGGELPPQALWFKG